MLKTLAACALMICANMAEARGGGGGGGGSRGGSISRPSAPSVSRPSAPSSKPAAPASKPAVAPAPKAQPVTPNATKPSKAPVFAPAKAPSINPPKTPAKQVKGNTRVEVHHYYVGGGTTPPIYHVTPPIYSGPSFFQMFLFYEFFLKPTPSQHFESPSAKECRYVIETAEQCKPPMVNCCVRKQKDW